MVHGLKIVLQHVNGRIGKRRSPLQCTAQIGRHRSKNVTNGEGPHHRKCLRDKALHKNSCASISRVLYSTFQRNLHHLSGTKITLRLYRPTLRNAACATRTDDPRTPFGVLPVYMAFQPVRFTKPLLSPAMLVVSYTTFSPLPPPCDGSAVSLSAALSVTPPSPVMFLPVRKHGALRCPDFPPLPQAEKAVERCTGFQ